MFARKLLVDVCNRRVSVTSWPLDHGRNFSLTPCCAIRKDQLDLSRYPSLNEGDLEEQFIKGGGPGGQKVNKSVSCVHLKHIPTGITVKVQHTRFQAGNRKIAREILLERLDEHMNGEMSVANQKKRLTDEKGRKSSSRRTKLAELKQSWKEREGLT